MGETNKGAPGAGWDRGTLRLLAVAVAVGMVAGAVVVASRVRSLNAQLAAAESRSQASSNDLLTKQDALEDELDRTRADLDAHEAALMEAEERARELRQANRSLRICASKSWPRGRPHVTLVPAHGPPGTRVEVVGDCFNSRFWSRKDATKGHGIGLLTRLKADGNPDPGLRKSMCELVASRVGSFEIGADGRMRGHFVVPPSGRCVQSKATQRMLPGRYRLIVGCRECAVARFQITSGASEKARLVNCSAGEWRLSLEGPERVGGSLLTGVRVDPIAGARCHLTGEVTLTLAGSAGSLLPLEANPVRAGVDAVVGNRVEALWAWRNWCGRRGPVSVTATLRAQAASRTLAAGPRCESRRRPSVVSAVRQWTKGVAPRP